MTREAYAKEVWKAVEAVCQDQEDVPCPHEDCGDHLRLLVASMRAGATVVCPKHGVIYRD